LATPRGGTRLELFSATEPDYPLAGYQVYSQGPDSAATTLLGLTDGVGAIQIPPADGPPLRLLYAVASLLASVVVLLAVLAVGGTVASVSLRQKNIRAESAELGA